jgi:hypothetical protein
MFEALNLPFLLNALAMLASAPVADRLAGPGCESKRKRRHPVRVPASDYSRSTG